MSNATALWAAIAAIGVYHGLNPAMGWPLAVANGLSERRGHAVAATFVPLAGGHLAAMASALLPFALLARYVTWSRTIQMSAGALLLVLGIYRLVQRRHPRAFARIRPTRLAWWSFLMATAHGAGLILVPFMLGLCFEAPGARGVGAVHAGMMAVLARSTVGIALGVAALHTLVMMLAGLAAAWACYRYLGLQVLRRAWFNLDAAWAASLLVAGAAGIATAI